MWRGRARGYVLGRLLLTKLAATGFTLAFTTALGTLWGGKIGGFDAFLFVVFALMALGVILLIVLYMGNIGKTGDSASAEVRRGTKGLDE